MIEISKAESPGRACQPEEKLKEEPWHEVARFAAYCAQGRSLGLKPWQSPPVAADAGRDDNAIRLRDRMLAAGLSIYEPDPFGALKAARAR